MEKLYGHIYVITHNNEPHLKFGKTASPNPLTRVSQYKTGASAAWNIELLIRVPIDKLDFHDNGIKRMLEEFNVKDGGGTEFYEMSVEGLSVFKSVFLYHNHDCTEVHQKEIDEMRMNNARGKPKKCTNSNGPLKLEERCDDHVLKRYVKSLKKAQRTKRIYFTKNLNIEPYSGRNGILESTPLDLDDVKSVKIWLDELAYITSVYRKKKLKNSKDKKISNVTEGNGNLQALLGKIHESHLKSLSAV